jgi:hypothetical protein
MAIGGSSHDHARALSQHKILSILADIAVVLVPAALVGFIIFVWRLDGAEHVKGGLDPWHNAIIVVGMPSNTKIKHATASPFLLLYLATAFPILFASIVGRLWPPPLDGSWSGAPR